jgi:hypothetical protein
VIISNHVKAVAGCEAKRSKLLRKGCIDEKG